MTNTNTATSCSNLTLIYLGLAIGAGIERHSFWVGLCVFWSLEFTALAFDSMLKGEVGQFYSWAIIGVGLGELAYVLSNYTPKVSWMGAFLILLGLAYVLSGWIALSEKSLRSWLGFFVELAGLLAMSYAFGWIQAQTPAQLTWKASFATWNVWAYLLLFADIFVVIWVFAAANNETGGPYLFASFLSVAMAGGMAWITASKPAWMSITIWVLNGLAMVIGGWQLNNGYRKKGFVIPGIILGILSTMSGILIAVYWGRTDELTLLATLQNIHFHWKDMWTFFWGLIISIWGAVYLVFFFIFTQRWVRRVGGLFGLMLLLGWVGFVGLDDSLVSSVRQILSSSPPAALKLIILASQAQYGNAVVGILAMSVFITILMIPVFISSMKMARSFQQLAQLQAQAGAGSAATNDLMVRNSGEFLKGSLDWLLTGVVSLTITIALWITLHNLALQGTLYTLPILGLPNLAIPHWKPVWELRYFILPIALGLIVYFPGVIYRRFKIQTTNLSLWGTILLYLFVGLFVPAGVMLYFIAQGITQLIVIPISMIGKPAAAIPPRRSVPGVPLLVSPNNNASTREKSITFYWLPGPGATPTGYILVVDGIPYSAGSSTSMQLSLIPGSHTWMVQATSPYGSSDLSNVYQLEIIAATPTVRPPGTPVLISPENRSVVTTAAVAFTWQVGPGRKPAGYNLEVDGRVYQTSLTTKDLPLEPGSHTWRVQAYFEDKFSEYSAPYTLQVHEEEHVYRHKNPVVDLLITNQDEILFSDSKGLVYTFTESKASKLAGATGTAALGFALLPENRLAVIRKDGQIEISSRAAGDEPQVFHVKYPIAHFAINPLGTKLFYSSVEADSPEVVWDFNFLNQKEIRLSEHTDEVTALTFLENQSLAVGIQCGDIDVITVSNKSLVSFPAFPEVSQSGIIFLAAGPAGQWIAVYENDVIAHWNRGDNQAPKDQRRLGQKVTCLCVDITSGNVAIGQQGGAIQVFPLDLGAPIFSQQVFNADVVKMAFLNGGESLVGASKDHVIQKIDL
jgi:hypothetical protein